jgi:hypothetical protein
LVNERVGGGNQGRPIVGGELESIDQQKDSIPTGCLLGSSLQVANGAVAQVGALGQLLLGQERGQPVTPQQIAKGSLITRHARAQMSRRLGVIMRPFVPVVKPPCVTSPAPERGSRNHR